MENRFNTQEYRDKGLVVVGVDPNGDQADGVQAFCDHVHATYQIGLESAATPTYKAFTQNFQGLNPYPVDIVVGKTGNIAYIAREYDPAAMQLVIDAELAK